MKDLLYDHKNSIGVRKMQFILYEAQIKWFLYGIE